MRKILIISLFLLWPRSVPVQQSNWINVTSYGVKADGVTDDTPAISAAIQAALAAPQYRGETVVYFAPLGYYDIKTPLVLPATPKRITLWIDSPLKIEATITIHSGYTIHGTESDNAASGHKGYTPFYAWYNANPAIHIQAAGLTLENIKVVYPHGSNDGIVIDNSSDIELDNTYVQMDSHNTLGIPLKITGGFRIKINGGGYTSYGSAPAIYYASDPNGSTSGIFTIENAPLINGGITLENSGYGGINGVSIDGGLVEVSSKPFLTLRTGANASGISGVEIHHVHFADSVPPGPPLIDAHGPAGYLRSVTVANCFTDGLALTSGDPIWGLEVWSALDYKPGVIAQPDHYIYHGPNGIKDTMPRIP
jgi:hypothetical protein